MKRGEIYYITDRTTFGAEIIKARPGVIVSNDILNHSSEVVEVVYLTTQPKKVMATHTIINATGRESTVLCEQIDSVSINLVGDYCGTCTPDEMLAIDRALCASLDLARARTVETPRIVEDTPDREPLDELERVKAERDRYAKMLDTLFDMQVGVQTDEH